MQGLKTKLKFAQGGGGAQAPQQGRSAPKGMPQEIPSGNRVPPQAQRPQDVLPTQKPVTDEVTVRPPARWKIILKRVGVGLLLCIALSMAYVFLLLGEPDNSTVETSTVQEETIRVPMAAVEAHGDADANTMAATFGKPMMVLYGDGLALQKVSLYDTAFQGGYARRATLTYAFADGQLLTVDSIRPTAAAALLGGKDFSLRVDGMHALAGMDAAWMESGKSICVFGKSDQAVYAVTCPSAHEAELSALLKQTTLLQPQMNAQ